MKKGLFAFLLTFMLGIFTVSAQVENPAQWSYSQKSLGNNEYELVFKAALEPGWHIYSMYTPEGGPMATTVTFEEAKFMMVTCSAIVNYLVAEYGKHGTENA